MKVGVFLINAIDPSLGGNFSYHEKFITALDAYNFHDGLEICYVGRLPKKKINFKRGYVRLASSALYGFFYVFNKLNITPVLSRVVGFNLDLCARIDASILRKHKIDILLFPIQFLKGVNDFPFITMNWDAGHKTTYAFPEILENYGTRERWHRVEIQKALAIFVESQSSKLEFSHFFNIPQEKIEVIPIFPGSVVDQKVTDEQQIEILKKFSLEKLQYFYYPAQFWAHKNHYNLLLGFKKIVKDHRGIKLVFSGSDKGNKDYIVSVIKDLGLQDNVRILGFISNEEVYTLYKNALALTMATFLGPTNMPLLEAQALNTAVICSDLAGHRELCGEAALYVDPANPEQWTEAIAKMLNEEFRLAMIRKGNEMAKRSPFNIKGALLALEKALIRFTAIRKTFY